MKTATSNYKIKELERRVAILEGLPRPKNEEDASSVLAKIHDSWADKPRTRRDLKKAPSRLWGRMA